MIILLFLASVGIALGSFFGPGRVVLHEQLLEVNNAF
jgi:hypothetical protein